MNAEAILRSIERQMPRIVSEGPAPRVLTSEEEAALLELLLDNELKERARQALVFGNIRLAYNLARRYAANPQELEDIVQDAVVGLTRASEKFDPEMGYRFTTYATWWIRQAIVRERKDHGHMIRIPVHQQDSLHRLLRIQDQETQRLGREPTAEELAAASEFPQSVVDELLSLPNTVSYDTPMESDDSDLVKIDILEDPNSPGEAAALQALIGDELDGLLKVLSSRERLIIRYRFGLDDGVFKPLEEVGQRFGVTRERIRQIEQKSLRRLGHAATRRRMTQDLLLVS